MRRSLQVKPSRSRFAALAGVVALAGLLAVSAPAQAPAAAALTDGAVFNYPSASVDQQRVILTQLHSLIVNAAAGSDIRVAVYHLSLTSFAQDLVDAEQRGVRVKVIVDHSATTLDDGAPNPAYDLLVQRLGSDRSAASWVMACSENGACIGSAGTPIMHNKFFLFSSTSGASNVVVQSSSNMTGPQLRQGWNNAVTLVGNNGIYNAYLSYFNDLAAMAKTDNYYRTTTSGNAKTYFFPRAGSDASTDTVYGILGNVSCGGGTVVRVAMYQFTRTALAQRLWDLDNKGCTVQVLYTEMGDGAHAALTKSGGAHGGPACRLGVSSYIDPATGARVDTFVHSKYLLVQGTYTGTAGQKLVFTGSHNYTLSALRENDEALLKIDSDVIHDQYAANFNNIWNAVPATC
jgi:phosphatidylserine/phosphatidylglycerophosphate/cardiolipin synthase-like enzyme